MMIIIITKIIIMIIIIIIVVLSESNIHFNLMIKINHFYFYVRKTFS